MPNTTLTSREFNQELSRAKRDARNGPVIITDRGTPSHVLLSYADYARMTVDQPGIVAALSFKGLSDIEFAPEKAVIDARSADLSS